MYVHIGISIIFNFNFFQRLLFDYQVEKLKFDLDAYGMFPVNLETLLSVSQYGVLDIITIIKLLYITENINIIFFR